MTHRFGLLLWSVAAAALASCSHGGLQVPSQSRILHSPAFTTGGVAPSVPPSIPALALSGAGDIYLYDSSYRQIGFIPEGDGEGAIAFDIQGNIYYAPYEQYSYYVLIFSPPYSGKPQELVFSSIGYVRGVTVDWRTGVFAVKTDAPVPYPNYYSTVWFFRHGQTKACASINEPSSWAWDVAGSFDSHGTLFVSGSSGPGSTFISISGECSAKTFVSYSPRVQALHGYQFNTKDELVVHQSTGYTQGPLVTYPHPQNGHLGMPISKVKLDDVNGKPVGFLTLTNDGAHLWAAAFYGDVAEYQYPEGGKPHNPISVEYVGGGAVYPPAIP